MGTGAGTVVSSQSAPDQSAQDLQVIESFPIAGSFHSVACAVWLGSNPDVGVCVVRIHRIRSGCRQRD